MGVIMSEKKQKSLKSWMPVRFLWLAVLPLAVALYGCSSVEDGEKKEETKKEESKEDRFAFLRREEQKKVKKAYESIDMEQVESKLPGTIKISQEKLGALAGSKVVASGATTASRAEKAA